MDGVEGGRLVGVGAAVGRGGGDVDAVLREVQVAAREKAAHVVRVPRGDEGHLVRARWVVAAEVGAAQDVDGDGLDAHGAHEADEPLGPDAVPIRARLQPLRIGPGTRHA